MTPHRKQFLIGIALAVGVSLFGCAGSQARPLHHRQHANHGFVPRDANGNQAHLVTVNTAAGIPVKVAPDFAGAIKGFISDLVERGYKPHRINCYSWAKSHVRHSLHHSGRACDFDQRGWGKTARSMYHVRDLARKWGLRDGCSFHDCGHIDAGPSPRLANSGQYAMTE